MLKRSEVVALTREATRRAMAKEIGVVPASKKHKERLAQLKAGRTDRASAPARRAKGRAL